MKTFSFILSLLISITALSQSAAYLHDLDPTNTVNAGDSLPVWQLDGKTRSATFQKVKDFIGGEPSVTAPFITSRYWNGFKKFVAFNADSIPAGNTNKWYSNSLVQAYADTRYSLLGHIHAASEITSGNFAYQRLATGTPNAGYVPVYNNGGIITWQAQSGANANPPLYKDLNGYLTLPAPNSETDGYFPASLYNLLMGKQDSLRSGITLKTINNTSLLGPGNIDVSAGGTVTTDAVPTSGSTNPVQSDGVYNALQGKANNSITVNGQPLTGNVTISKSNVGLGNVDNTSDATKNSAAAVLTNKDLTSSTNTFPSTLATLSGAQTLTNKTLASPIINSPSGLTKVDVELSNVDNTSDVNKPLSNPTKTYVDNNLRDSINALKNQRDTIPINYLSSGHYFLYGSHDTLNQRPINLFKGTGIDIVDQSNDAEINYTIKSDFSALRFSKILSLKSPSGSEAISMGYTPIDLYVTDVVETIKGANPSVTYKVSISTTPYAEDGGQVINAHTLSTATIASSPVAANITLIPAGSYITFTTTAVSGTIDDFNLTLIYHQ